MPGLGYWQVTETYLALSAALKSPQTIGPTIPLGIIKQEGFGLDFEFKDGTPIILAARMNRFDVVEALLEEGANVKAIGPDGFTALHLAILLQANEAICSAIVRAGADLSATDGSGATPLHLAVRQNREDVAQMLVTAGAPINKRDATHVGKTPLHCACESDNIGVMEYLLKNGANPFTNNSEGRTPLHVASYSDLGRAVSLLVSHSGHTLLEAKDYSGYTALWHAAEFGCRKSCESLLAHGADVNCTTSRYETIIHYMARRPKYATGVTKLLLDNGADILDHGKTFLIKPLKDLDKRVPLYQLLLAEGAVM